MKELWDTRYGTDSYAYGSEPNEFFRSQLSDLSPGKILLPGEGEGRNAVFAASLGWDVLAFDISKQGKNKAKKLAAARNVSIEYEVEELGQIYLPENHYDAIGLIYTHFPPQVKSTYHAKLSSSLKRGGIIILEAFSKSHLEVSSKNEKPSGPQNLDMLFAVEDIIKDFSNYEIILLKEQEIDLNEGLYHIGRSSVIRFVGVKR
jgi:cyclopropane fatty-acyl-phospholipid synthase-like methyltransferase